MSLFIGMKLLKLNWWMDSPIDYEHKKWVFLDYLKKLDDSFIEQQFSPSLLHSEKLLSDMEISHVNMLESRLGLIKKRFIIRDGMLGFQSVDLSDGNIDTFFDILDYSIPLLKHKVEFGRKLWRDNPTLLW